MLFKYTRWSAVSIFLIVAMLLAACSPIQRPEDTRLKMGLLPILDILPFYVADQKGYFKAEGITIEFVPVKSAQERDALMQAGEIDGMLNDLISTGLFNRDEIQIKIVSTARRAYPESPQFRVLAAPNSGITSAQDLAGVPVGISQNTVIEYITDRLLRCFSPITPLQKESLLPLR